MLAIARGLILTCLLGTRTQALDIGAELLILYTTVEYLQAVISLLYLFKLLGSLRLTIVCGVEFLVEHLVLGE